jgi:transposase InsO family protein
MKFAFIAAEKGRPVKLWCRALGVSRAGFYAWRRRQRSRHEMEDQRLAVQVREAFEQSRRNYGSPRVHAELQANGVHVSRKRVIRLMQQQGLVARVRRRYRCTTMSDHDQPIAPNRLNRQFDPARPNQSWVGDTTELITGNGKLYLAVILDLYSRFVVGWALSPANDRHLTMRALHMALQRRCPGDGLLHHSDQGSTYASEDYQKLLEEHGIACSMSRRGNCYDNAVMESWFSTLKSELGERFTTHEHAQEQVFDFIEVFYNQRRRHSALGYLTPAQFDRTSSLAAVA